jgi:DNA-binding LacI/PurR family transcriptional regulator
MRENVQVPEELSVVSDDDLPSATTCYVPLTAVSQPVQKIAETVVELLETRLKNPEITPRCSVIEGKLTSRCSVAKISL